MSKSNYYSRRNFLKVSAGTLAVGASSSLLSGCSSFERTFSGDKRNLDEEVIVLGAGAAGLAAAYTLKKNKIPYRVFEASGRPGGRVYTLERFSEDGMFAELGAEFFDESHTRLFQICKELNLEVQELKAPRPVFWTDGKSIADEDYRRRLRPLSVQLARHHVNLFGGHDVTLSQENMNKFEKALYYDNLSAQDFILSLRTDVDELTLQLFLYQVRNRFGAEPSGLSALQLLYSLNYDGALNLQGPRSRFRIAQGMGMLTRSLYERAAGVIPDHFLKMESPLDSIVARATGFDLTFKTPSGKKTYLAHQVICTLPFSALRDVGGIEKMEFSPLKKDLIQSQVYASQSKGVLEFADAAWSKKNSGDWLGNFASESFFDSGRGQPNKGGLISSVRGGKAGLDLGPAQMGKEAMEDLDKVLPGAKAALKSNMAFMNWGGRNWQRGSRSYYTPGQFSRFGGVAGQAEYQGKFLFAGEHTSPDFSGSLEGAVASGIAAAEAAMKARG